MAEEKHHHFFHHKEETSSDPRKEEKHHKHMEQLGELGAHEKHQAKKDPENAHKHKVTEEIAATVAVGSAGFAFHEHHEKKEAKRHGHE
ncbi:hypothetical protein ZIOFF_033391 [Zingiber officinale]|uniref:Uncharacterized protein n=1 Tax=Zingiber officinale TaxID=94328 RepID=A0A8J5GK83_ZINOF|nr:hypothetical protein ZIOFF_036935 [Zingiber officinale]KAG6508036.1 hypothetical protein ZIOFF_033391 [Zingiber officinale]